MRRLAWAARLAVWAALALFLRGEIARYGAGIDLRTARDLLLAAAEHPGDPRVPAALARARDMLEELRPRLPGDYRVPYFLGSRALLAREPADAIVRLREALAIEERPEIDVNLSRAYVGAGDAASAAEAALRATWISPDIASQFPADTRAALYREVIRRIGDLSGGNRDAVPPLPASDAAAGQDDR